MNLSVLAKAIKILTFILFFYSLNSCYNNHKSNVLNDSYLGLNPPGLEAEVFAPGIVSTENRDALYGAFDNGAFIIYTSYPKNYADRNIEPIYILKKDNNGLWQDPQRSPLLTKPWFHNLENVETGKIKIFADWDVDSLTQKTTDIYLCRSVKLDTNWSKPEKLPPPINVSFLDTWPSLTDNGVLYFFSDRKGGFGKADIYKSVPIDGEYKHVENLGGTINTGAWEHDPLIAPDESYLIFSSFKEGGYGEDDLYISFKDDSDKWSDPINMGSKINSTYIDNRPKFSEDMKYLFFTSTRKGNLDIFWVDIKIIDELKP